MNFSNNSITEWSWNYVGTTDTGAGVISPGEYISIPFPAPVDELSEPGIRLISANHPENTHCLIKQARVATTLAVEQVNGGQVNQAEYGYSGLLPNFDNVLCFLNADMSIQCLSTFEGESNPVAPNIFNAEMVLPL